MDRKVSMHRCLGVSVLLTFATVVGCLGASRAQSGLRFEMVTISQGRAGWWSAQATYPRFMGRSPLEALATRTLQVTAARGVAEFAAEMKDAFPTHAKPVQPFEYRLSPIISLARPAIVSMYFEDWEYGGGVHPNTFYAAYDFGLIGETPRLLTLNDLFRPGTAGAKVVSDLVIAHLKQEPEALWVQEGTVKTIDPKIASRFVITPTALTILIQPYEVGPYSSGPFFVKVPFAEFRGSLDAGGPLKSLFR